MPTKIKICGIRCQEDVAILNEYKPDFAGFVLAPSKRQVEVPALCSLLSALNKEIVPVGVFVNPQLPLILDAVAAGIKILQLHGDETPADIENLRNHLVERNETDILIWKALRIKTREKTGAPNPQAGLANNYSGLIDGILYDKYNPNMYGGTGEAFDWKLIPSRPLLSGRDEESLPLILAGGLSATNVQTAITAVCPYGVDVSSGVETNSRKDREKVGAFIQLVRSPIHSQRDNHKPKIDTGG